MWVGQTELSRHASEVESLRASKALGNAIDSSMHDIRKNAATVFSEERDWGGDV